MVPRGIRIYGQLRADGHWPVPTHALAVGSPSPPIPTGTNATTKALVDAVASGRITAEPDM
jgi:hypothetical protein